MNSGGAAPVLELKHVKAAYGRIEVLHGITLKVEASFGLLIDAGKLARLEARVIGGVSLEVTWQEMVDVIVGAGAT